MASPRQLPIIGIVSAKGGVGKTTTVANIGAALTTAFNKRVLAVDGNVTTANLGFHLDLIYPPVTLLDVLKGKSDINQAIYTHDSGLQVIPAALNPSGPTEIGDLGHRLAEVAQRFDVVLIDSAPDFTQESTMVTRAATEILIVTTPDVPSVTTSSKVMGLARSNRLTVRGVVVNRVTGRTFEMTKQEIEKVIGAPVVAEIPEDPAVQEAVAIKKPVVLDRPLSPAALRYKKLAANLVGESFTITVSLRLRSLIARISESFFGRNVRKRPDFDAISEGPHKLLETEPGGTKAERAASTGAERSKAAAAYTQPQREAARHTTSQRILSREQASADARKQAALKRREAGERAFAEAEKELEEVREHVEAAQRRSSEQGSEKGWEPSLKKEREPFRDEVEEPEPKRERNPLREDVEEPSPRDVERASRRDAYEEPGREQPTVVKQKEESKEMISALEGILEDAKSAREEGLENLEDIPEPTKGKKRTPPPEKEEKEIEPTGDPHIDEIERLLAEEEEEPEEESAPEEIEEVLEEAKRKPAAPTSEEAPAAGAPKEVEETEREPTKPAEPAPAPMSTPPKPAPESEGVGDILADLGEPAQPKAAPGPAVAPPPKAAPAVPKVAAEPAPEAAPAAAIPAPKPAPASGGVDDLLADLGEPVQPKAAPEPAATVAPPLKAAPAAAITAPKPASAPGGVDDLLGDLGGPVQPKAAPKPAAATIPAPKPAPAPGGVDDLLGDLGGSVQPKAAPEPAAAAVAPPKAAPAKPGSLTSAVGDILGTTTQRPPTEPKVAPKPAAGVDDLLGETLKPAAAAAATEAAPAKPGGLTSAVGDILGTTTQRPPTEPKAAPEPAGVDDLLGETLKPVAAAATTEAAPAKPGGLMSTMKSILGGGPKEPPAEPAAAPKPTGVDDLLGTNTSKSDPNAPKPAGIDDILGGDEGGDLDGLDDLLDDIDV